MRRKAGLAGLLAQKKAREKMQSLANKIEEDNIEHMTTQLKIFREKLAQFAAKHKDRINQNPQFRHQFQQLCAKTGVDPLASRQGFWSQFLGLGGFYYELAIQVIQLCLALREENGGLISLKELHKNLTLRRGHHQQPASIEDVEQAIKCVQSLGSGFCMVKIGNEMMVVSVPCELNTDHSKLIQHAKESKGYITLSSRD
ncbi:hypothetical protein AAMO2058_000657000 [Amorphochlora amoebiformis]